GLDIDSLDVVVNYHLGRDSEDHLHRIGRTGRAGESGIAWSFYDGRDKPKIEQLQEALGRTITNESLPPASTLNQPVPRARMVTLLIDGGKKQKIRPGDILGALTGENGVEAAHVGKIKVVSNRSFVAVSREAVKAALAKLSAGKLKGRACRVRTL
ncbi:MAG: DbpA RNA binding domain-containing protein, partial [Granulosicoccus sp.]